MSTVPELQAEHAQRPATCPRPPAVQAPAPACRTDRGMFTPETDSQEHQGGGGLEAVKSGIMSRINQLVKAIGSSFGGGGGSGSSSWHE